MPMKKSHAICENCKERTYMIGSTQFNGFYFHKSCFRCSNCQLKLTVTNAISVAGNLFCHNHAKQMQMEYRNQAKSVVSQAMKQSSADQSTNTSINSNIFNPNKNHISKVSHRLPPPPAKQRPKLDEDKTELSSLQQSSSKRIVPRSPSSGANRFEKFRTYSPYIQSPD